MSDERINGGRYDNTASVIVAAKTMSIQCHAGAICCLADYWPSNCVHAGDVNYALLPWMRGSLSIMLAIEHRSLFNTVHDLGFFAVEGLTVAERQRAYTSWDFCDQGDPVRLVAIRRMLLFWRLR